MSRKNNQRLVDAYDSLVQAIAAPGDQVQLSKDTAETLRRWLDGEMTLKARPAPTRIKRAKVLLVWQLDQRLERGDDPHKARKDFVRRYGQKFGESGEWVLEHLGKYRACYKQFGFK